MDDNGRRHWPSAQDVSWDPSFRSCLLPISMNNETNNDSSLKLEYENKNDIDVDKSLTTTNHDDSIDASSCYLCTHCGKGCSTERELNYHISTEHEDFEEETNGDDSPIDDTNKSGHQYLCKFCPRTFSSSSTLNVHYTHTHRDKPQYDCEICGQCFTVKRELATHRRLHEGQPTHRCRQCGKEFGTKQLLRKHELWHTGERSHVCPQCGKAFFQKGHLTQHLMIHAGGRPHACHLCPKTFIFKFDLNRHMKIHAERGNSNNGELLLTSSCSLSPPPQIAEDSIQILKQSTTNGTNNDHSGNNLLTSLTPMFRRRQHVALGRSNSVHSSTIIDDNDHCCDKVVFDAESRRNIADTNNLPETVNDETINNETKSEVSPTNSSVYSLSGTTAANSNFSCCEKCIEYRNQLETSRRCVVELETLLVQRHSEIEALKWKVQRVGEVAGHLLETCSDFDKLWMLHSKKVYSQMQNVLSTLQ